MTTDKEAQWLIIHYELYVWLWLQHKTIGQDNVMTSILNLKDGSPYAGGFPTGG